MRQSDSYALAYDDIHPWISDARRNETSPSVQTLLEFFKEKVEAVCRANDGSPVESYHDQLAASFAEFEQCTPNAVENVIQSATSTSCSLDPIPTTILKEFLPELLPFVSRMCNASLQEGILPLSQRHAIVTPRLKKPGSDASDVKNYRPISNLSFMSKVVERLVCQQLVRFLEKHNLLPKCQSAYRRYHSTETVVLKIVSKALSAAEKAK